MASGAYVEAVLGLRPNSFHTSQATKAKAKLPMNPPMLPMVRVPPKMSPMRLPNAAPALRRADSMAMITGTAPAGLISVMAST